MARVAQRRPWSYVVHTRHGSRRYDEHVTPSLEALARIRALLERRLSPEEFRSALAVPLGEDEEEERRSLIRWFRRRYPTPAERLACARHAYRRWRDAAPPTVRS